MFTSPRTKISSTSRYTINKERFITEYNADSIVRFTREDFINRGGYIPDGELITLVNVSVGLGKPLLLEGPPGTGKTALAKALSAISGRELIRIQCFEGISAEQVIGEFNYTKQLLALEKAKGAEIKDLFTQEFFIPRALMQALTAEKPVVLLIDEIDRSDEEFEAFLLEALGEQQITVPELGTLHSKTVPFIVMTSNNTRPLSPALRRRSIYIALEYPTSEREKEILRLHLPELQEDISDEVLSLVRKMRTNDRISDPPSVAETIEFAKALLFMGENILDDKRIKELYGVLLKSKGDLFEAKG